MQKLLQLVLILVPSIWLANLFLKNNQEQINPDHSRFQKPCILRETGQNGEKVCVCNATYCDNIPRPAKVEPPVFIQYTTSKSGLRFSQNFGKFGDGGTNLLKKIHINHQKQYQRIEGWGGAFTDATGINILSLDEGAQDLLLESYFAENGIKYSLCRVPIGCTDFGTRPYSYVDTDEPDLNLTHFELAEEDIKYKIPLMMKAKRLNRKLNFFGTTWTSPRWMKKDNQYSGLNSYIKKEYYQVWADYMLRFLDEYMLKGIYFWGITTQNEPYFGATAPKPIPTVRWDIKDLAGWIAQNLGPIIRDSNFADLKILTVDDQLNDLPWLPSTIWRNADARKYIDGIATHWYYSHIASPTNRFQTHERFPDMMLLTTEACTGWENSNGVDLGSWERGERYGSNIIEDMLFHYSGWVDWNMALDLQGGPTYIDNFVDSPIIVNASAGEFYKQPMYYTLGHFSKFVPPGALRIDSRREFDENLAVVAFTVPDNGNEIVDDDGETVVVLLNKCEEEKRFLLVDDLMGTTEVTLPGRSISTLLYWPPE